jgi:uncharacterized repeat protein (TIGR03803 family)
VVFKLSPSGTETVLYSFTGGSDGGGPYAGLIADSSGNLYGTTQYGGTSGAGVVFKLTGAGFTSGPPCTVTYQGTFNGNLNISSGLTCIINGTVTGNVMESGGGLFTSNATIDGNLQISGASTFTLDPGSAVHGDLQVQNLPEGTAQNQICGSSVQGNLQVQDSGTALLIGASSSCAGNTVGGNLEVQSNTAAVQVFGNGVTGNLQVQSNTAVQVFNNTVTNNLQCSGNSSITGGGNTAKSMQGQCATF